ncbi:hypothetical protein KY308_01980 [Candidatus Woesearchaeota archaeon]|nr:hypothetical protein [Candidatus Woesearchaeota archaeon]
MKMPSIAQITAIEDKIKQLKEVKEKKITVQELAKRITDRRLNWLLGNSQIIAKYSNLPPEEAAHRIIYLEHMEINPEHSQVIRVREGIIQIKSYNFCPYLMACKELGLDTRIVCKKIGEQSIVQMCRALHPKLEFRRNYNKIRPHNPEFCEEYIFLKP